MLRTVGLSGPRPARPTLAHVLATARRLHLFQIDAVNVLVRAQYLPAFSRLGPYPIQAVDALAYRRRQLFEASAHAQSLVHVALHPLLRWRMADHAANSRWLDALGRTYLDSVLGEVSARGPLTPPELADPGVRRDGMWGRTKGKAALDWLVAAGLVAVSGRRGMELVYDQADRVIPPEILAKPTPDRDEARRELILFAARVLGVATVKEIADYFRIRHAAPIVRNLVAEGALESIRVEQWTQPAFMVPGTVLSRRAPGARALVSPFDPLVWERDRTERLFGFRYRIEIYNRPHEREYGYYVLPFLLDDALVARVDLKADRKGRMLLVQAAHAEPGVNVGRVASELDLELGAMAEWLGLDDVTVVGRGNLSPMLAAAAPRR